MKKRAKLFELIKSSTLDDVISEDVPQINTTVRQVIEQDPELISLSIANEAGSSMFEWTRPQEEAQPSQLTLWSNDPSRHSLTAEIGLAGETFGRITVAWDVSKSDRRRSPDTPS